MAKSKNNPPRQPSPVMFRPTPELGAMVTAFAAERGVGINEMYKNLVRHRTSYLPQSVS